MCVLLKSFKKNSSDVVKPLISRENKLKTVKINAPCSGGGAAAAAAAAQTPIDNDGDLGDLDELFG